MQGSRKFIVACEFRLSFRCQIVKEIYIRVCVFLMTMIAFITIDSSLVPLIESLRSRHIAKKNASVQWVDPFQPGWSPQF